MKDFSYTRSGTLNTQLQQIEELRKKLLLTPLSPRDELKFQWEALLAHIHYGLLLSGVETINENVISVLSPQGKKKMNESELQIVKYKEALDYLYHHWLVSERAVEANDIVQLFTSAFDGHLRISEDELDKTLKYIQVNPENPIIQAALAQFLILSLYPFDRRNEEFSQLVFLLFLYKNGYDFRRMLSIEKAFVKDLASYKNLIARLGKESNLTVWLEYITKSISLELEDLLKHIAGEKQSILSNSTHSLLALNDRQKSILSALNQPGLKINNALVQKMFKISQITASRDLAKLNTLGLVISIGAGRSTFYTKA